MTRFWLRWYLLGAFVTAIGAALFVFSVHGGGLFFLLAGLLLPGLWVAALFKPLLPASGPVVLVVVLVFQVVAWHLLGMFVQSRRRQREGET